jgi:precorrin-6B methylase 2
MLDRPALEGLIPLLSRLSASMEALAAVAVHLASKPRPHPALADAVAAVARQVGVPDGLTADDRAVAVAFAQAFFRQAADLLEHPDRAPGWSFDDGSLLESQGRASAILARILCALPEDMPVRRALAREGSRFLDVGTGVAWLAIAMARAFPRLSVVGIDREERVLSRARENVRTSGVGERVELRHADAASLRDEVPFDAAWLPGPFLDVETFPRVAERTRERLAPGAWVVVGTYGDADPLLAALADLRTLRSGGTLWTSEALAAALERAGFEGVTELPKVWAAPIRLVVAHTTRGAV